MLFLIIIGIIAFLYFIHHGREAHFRNQRNKIAAAEMRRIKAERKAERKR